MKEVHVTLSVNVLPDRVEIGAKAFSDLARATKEADAFRRAFPTDNIDVLTLPVEHEELA